MQILSRHYIRDQDISLPGTSGGYTQLLKQCHNGNRCSYNMSCQTSQDIAAVTDLNIPLNTIQITAETIFPANLLTNAKHLAFSTNH